MFRRSGLYNQSSDSSNGGDNFCDFAIFTLWFEWDADLWKFKTKLFLARR
jgi:hypothetical protein